MVQILYKILIKELQMIFQTSHVSICPSYIKDPIGTSTSYTKFLVTLKLFHVSVAKRRLEVQNAMCNSFKNIFTTSWGNLNKIRWSKLYTKFGAFWQKVDYHVYQFWRSVGTIFAKRFLQVKQLNDAKLWIKRPPYFFIPKITVVW